MKERGNMEKQSKRFKNQEKIKDNLSWHPLG